MPNQQIAIASYIHPKGDEKAWDRLIAYPHNKLSVLIANVVNGPDNKFNKDWDDTIAKAKGSGKTVIGYVRTGYLGVSKQKFKTRLGSTRLSDWVAQIEQDVNMWFKLYPGKIGGIFFDEGWNDCGENNIYAETYRFISDNTKIKFPGAYTVLNPGDYMPECFEHSSDTLLTFESSFARYTDGANYTANTWTSSDPRKIWHIIYDVPQSEIPRVAALTRERGAGLIEITNDVMDNPYDDLPDDGYMQVQLAAVSGGSIMREDPRSLPNDGPSAPTPGYLRSVPGTDDYSSVTLDFPYSSDAYGYKVEVDGIQDAYYIPGFIQNTIEIGGLDSGKQHKFRVRAVGKNGQVSQPSSELAVSTLPLPDGLTIGNIKYETGDTYTRYEAEIWVPYGFIRLFIWNDIDKCAPDTNPAWSVNFNDANWVCTKYMVENTALFKYTGEYKPDDKLIPWKWTKTPTDKPLSKDKDVVPVGRGKHYSSDKYKWTWQVPLTMGIIDTTKFILFVEGYGPTTYMFVPCIKDYFGMDKITRFCAHASPGAVNRQPDIDNWLSSAPAPADDPPPLPPPPPPPPPSPPPPTPTVPPPPGTTILIMRLESSVTAPGGWMADWSREWDVWPETVHRASDTCPKGVDIQVPVIGDIVNVVSSIIDVLKGYGPKPIRSQDTHQSSGTYPYDDITNIKIAGTTCVYKAKGKEEIGTLSCVDGRKTSCKKDTSSWAYCGLHFIRWTFINGYTTTPSLMCIID
jgi:hypothetical protein